MRSLVSYGFLAPPALFITLCLVGAVTALVSMRAIPRPRRAARSVRCLCAKPAFRIANSLVTGKRAANFICSRTAQRQMVWFAVDLPTSWATRKQGISVHCAGKILASRRDSGEIGPAFGVGIGFARKK